MVTKAIAAASGTIQYTNLIPVNSSNAAPIASRSAPIVMTFATTISKTAGVATRAPKDVRSSVARSLLVTLATLADIC